jgi:Amt family ammonium transporter
MNRLPRRGILRRVDDALGVLHTHGIAGALGGLLTGVLANPAMLVYAGLGKNPGVAVAGLLYGNPRQLFVQAVALVAVVVYSGGMTWVLTRAIGWLVPLRMPDLELEAGDSLIHGEDASDTGTHLPHPTHDRRTPIPAYAYSVAGEDNGSLG